MADSQADAQFDVFLCHNSEDKPAVIEIAQALQHNGLKPWLDSWALRPGVDWQDVLEAQIECIHCVAVFVGEAGFGPWQRQELKAYIRAFINQGSPVIPVLLPSAPKVPKLPIFLQSFHWVDFRLPKPDPLEQLVWGITGQRPQGPLSTSAGHATTEPEAATIASASAQAELAALRAELERLKAQKQPAASTTVQSASAKTDPEVELKSERGIDYTRLRDLLKAGNWQEADQETDQLMLKAVGEQAERRGYLKREEIRNFPCEDLLLMDQLWVKFSGGKFGFSVQKQIWVEVGGKLDFGKDEQAAIAAFEKMSDRNGWRRDGNYIASRQVYFDTSAPKGHLPYNRRVVGWFSSLASRLVNCSR
jgi:uncharacterized small protein (DUF1192 family)